MPSSSLVSRKACERSNTIEIVFTGWRSKYWLLRTDRDLRLLLHWNVQQQSMAQGLIKWSLTMAMFNSPVSSAIVYFVLFSGLSGSLPSTYSTVQRNCLPMIVYYKDKCLPYYDKPHPEIVPLWLLQMVGFYSFCFVTCHGYMLRAFPFNRSPNERRFSFSYPFEHYQIIKLQIRFWLGSWFYAFKFFPTYYPPTGHSEIWRESFASIDFLYLIVNHLFNRSIQIFELFIIKVDWGHFCYVFYEFLPRYAGS